MSLLNVLILICTALLMGAARRGRSWLLLIGSVLAIYWIQPPTTIRYLDFWLPTITLGLTIISWIITSPSDNTNHESQITNALTSLVIAAIILLIASLRYIDPLCCLTANRPPVFWQVLIGVVIAAALGYTLWRSHKPENLLTALATLLLILFLVLKTEFLGKWVSTGLRILMKQDHTLATAAELQWLGFSFIAFRLIHTLRDRAAGRLPDLTLQEYVTFVLFFPALPAGPIDRIQRFVKDLHSPFKLSAEVILTGGQRIVWGLFKKFALADTLALIALNGINAEQVHTTGWTWILLYAYALRIYLDFSGYTDVAIGMAQLMGVNLPENFERPYLKPNLTTFWNSWHISLAQWFRAYWFNPLTRSLRSSKQQFSMAVIIFTGQISTMLLIGLWHGITWNFAIWGLWHGLGLFIHNRWSEATKARAVTLSNHPRWQRAISVGSTLLTFQYVTLSWVWFALQDVDMALKTFGKLFGIT